MTADPTDTLRGAAGFHEQADGAFVIEGLDFEGAVTVEDDRVRLEQTLPMLDAVVIGETVAPVVEEGWAETFERRARDVTNLESVPRTDLSIELGEEAITVRMSFDAETVDPEGVSHAANFVEGVWVEGIIPGYPYDEQVQGIRDRAADTGGTG